MIKQSSLKTVMLLCDYPSPYGGNFILSLKELAKTIYQNGYFVLFVFPMIDENFVWPHSLESAYSQLHYVNFQEKNGNLVDELISLCDRFHVVCIHCHFGSKKYTLKIIKKRKNIRLIWHLHSDFSLGKGKILRYLLVKSKEFLLYGILGRKILKICVSPHLAKYPNSIVIENGISPERFPAFFNAKSECTHSQPSSSRKEINFLLFAWDPEVKGLDVAVKAILNLNKRTKKRCNLFVVCRDRDGADFSKAWIKGKIPGFSDFDFIHFLPPTEDVINYYSMCDCFLSASRSEGYPYSVLESIILGKTCVVSDIPGVAWAKKYPNCFFFESDSPTKCEQACFAALSKMSDPAFGSLCEASGKRCLCDHNLVEWCDKVFSTYHLKKITRAAEHD